MSCIPNEKKTAGEIDGLKDRSDIPPGAEFICVGRVSNTAQGRANERYWQSVAPINGKIIKVDCKPTLKIDWP